MPPPRSTSEYVSYIIGLMQPLGPVRAKRMFGAHGISLDGLTFAIIADDVLYLKTDPVNENDFTERNLPAFSYSRKGKTVTLSYYQAPEEALEDADTMHVWASKAFAAAMRPAAKNKTGL